MINIFMSHSGEDKSLVLRFAKILESFSIRCWVDKLEIKPGQSLVSKIFTEGIAKSDYVLCFITPASMESRWVREELENAYVQEIKKGGPKIIALVFGDTRVPEFLIHRLYIKTQNEQQNLLKAVNDVLFAVGLESEINRKPVSLRELTVNNVYDAGEQLILLASRPNPLELDVFKDGEGVYFIEKQVYIFLFDWNPITGKWHCRRSHRLCVERIAHSAIGLFGDDIKVFINLKAANNTFAMDGRLFRLSFSVKPLRPKSVETIFSDRNWGWSPYFDSEGIIHHGSSEPGNHHIRANELLEEYGWQNIVDPAYIKYMAENCPFPILSGNKSNGYCKSIDIDFEAFSYELGNWTDDTGHS
jgi:TIR domain